MENQLEFKVVVVGPVGVGKSSLTLRYVQNEFNQSLDSTLGAVYMEKTTTIKTKKIKFQFWDTAGQERYRAIARIYYKDCKAAIVVYDISSHDSFQELKEWVQQIKTNAPENVMMTIVGNKVDLDKEGVPYQQAKKYADSLGAMLKYTSAKDGKGVNELFQAVGEKLIGKNQRDKNAVRQKRHTLEQKPGKKKKEKKDCC